MSCLPPLVVIDIESGTSNSDVDSQIQVALTATTACALPNYPPIYYSDSEYDQLLWGTVVGLILLSLPPVIRLFYHKEHLVELVYTNLPLYAQIASIFLIRTLLIDGKSGIKRDVFPLLFSGLILLPTIFAAPIWFSHFLLCWGKDRDEYQKFRFYAYLFTLIPGGILVYFMFNDDIGFDPILPIPLFKGLVVSSEFLTLSLP